LREGGLMEKVGKVSCPACGAPLASREFASANNGGVGRCSRCAMVAELIEELIRRQVSSGYHSIEEHWPAEASGTTPVN
jgi:hypothetical protein